MKLFFLIGTGRCGSTLLEEVLGRHPDVGFLSNVDAHMARFRPKGRWNNSLYKHIPRGLSQRDRIGRRSSFQRRLHFGPSEAWSMLFREVSPSVVAPCRDLTKDDVTPWIEERFKSFYQERARVQGKSNFMHKYTGWPRARFLHQIFPAARFVHVIRDGRAVANSLLQMPWWRGHLGPSEWRFGPLPKEYDDEWEQSGRSFVALAGIEWKLMMDAFSVARDAIPAEQWLDVCYEDFVDSPHSLTRRIARFLELPWSPEFEDRFSRHSFSADRKHGYLSELSASQIDLLNQLLANHLRELGYTEATRG